MLTTSGRLALTAFLVVALHAASQGVQNHRYITAAAAMVEDGRLSIDERYSWDDPDLVRIDGRRYPNMPPGLTTLVALDYWTFSHLTGVHVRDARPHPMQLFSMFYAVTVNAPLLAVMAVLMFRLLRAVGSPLETAVWLTLGLIFGTPLFAYSTQIWSHVVSATLAIGIFYFTITRGSVWAIGCLMGLLAVLENHSALSLGMLGTFWLWHTARDRGTLIGTLRDLLALAAAAAPFLIALLLYNHALTGSMFENAAAAWFTQNVSDASIFGWPTLERVWGMTFSLYRGIFIYAPLTLLAVWRAVRLRTGLDPVTRFSWLFAAGYFTLCVTFVQWDSGIAFGPRYFSTALPFVLVTLATAPSTTVRAWVLPAMLINWAGATTNPSTNLLQNLQSFFASGPLPGWIEYVQYDVLPVCCHVPVRALSPFWVFAVAGLILWRVWTPARR